MLNTFCSNTFVSSFSCDFPSLDGGYELDAIQFYKSPKFWDTFQLLVKCYATEEIEERGVGYLARGDLDRLEGEK
jgi:hypothetical protein